MSVQPSQSAQPEPIDTGTDPIQAVGASSDSNALVRAQARGTLEGHALPDALTNLAPAFRSHPAWVLVCQWTKQVFNDHDRTKQELSDTKSELETTQSNYFDSKLKIGELEHKLKAARRVSTYKTRWQVIGSFLLGLAPAAYFNTASIYGYLLGGIGLLCWFYAWREDSE